MDVAVPKHLELGKEIPSDKEETLEFARRLSHQPVKGRDIINDVEKSERLILDGLSESSAYVPASDRLKILALNDTRPLDNNSSGD